MKTFIFILLSCLWISHGESAKVLVYSPLFGHSHSNFMGKLADTLTEAGHDVTVLLPLLKRELAKKTGVKTTKKQILYTPSDDLLNTMDEMIKGRLEDEIWLPSKMGAMQMIQMGKRFSLVSGKLCGELLADRKLLDELKKEKFDVALAEPMFMCGLGLFRLLDIPSTISALSVTSAEYIFKQIGEPAAFSYVPSAVGSYSDKMTIWQRPMNIITSYVMDWFFTVTFDAEKPHFQNLHGIEFDGGQLIGESSFIFMNSNPYLNFPHPHLHKVVQIGGVAVDYDKDAKELSKEWKDILSKRSSTVLISFGSNARSDKMPDNFKQSFLRVFEAFPNVTFIWKYEDKDATLVDHLPNVHLSTWMPQNDLLADPRLTAFITHGGLGSSTELAYTGKKAIVIPLLGDQNRNAEMLARHGGVIVLKKEDLGNSDKILNSLKTLLNDPSYEEHAVRLSKLLRSQPTSPKQLVASHVDFAARFGKLPQLDSHARNQSFIEFYLLDILFIFLSAVTLLFVLIVALIRFCCCRQKTIKPKKD